MSEWADISSAPKDGTKFLIHCCSGTALADWSTQYEVKNGNSERVGECFHLVFFPSEISDGGEAYQWSLEKLKEMKSVWMPTPKAPKENCCKIFHHYVPTKNEWRGMLFQYCPVCGEKA